MLLNSQNEPTRFELFWVVVSNIFYFHPYLGKIPILTNIFQMGWNHQLVMHWIVFFSAKVTGNWGAFAAVRRDGSVVCWGDDGYGGDAGDGLWWIECVLCQKQILFDEQSRWEYVTVLFRGHPEKTSLCFEVLFFCSMIIYDRVWSFMDNLVLPSRKLT